MGCNGTSFSVLRRLLLALATTLSLAACEIDDTVLCDDPDMSKNDTACQQLNNPQSFTLTYTTANGTIPSGRYYYVASPAATSDALAEEECRTVLQNLLNTSSTYLQGELAELAQYRGAICGPGYELLSDLGDLRVKSVRRVSANQYDYDLELTCERQ